MQEGVIQFATDHTEVGLRAWENEAVEELAGWRSVLRDTGLLGEDPQRYGGLGYGNISMRVGPQGAPRGRRGFVVSGTQTAGKPVAHGSDFAVVDEWSVRENSLKSHGVVLPSSESLTHAVIYDEGAHVGAVFHGHSPDIWIARDRLRLPRTAADVPYGTVAMALATRELLRQGRAMELGAFVMLGHEDGVVAFGRTADEAGLRLIRLLAAARAGRREDA